MEIGLRISCLLLALLLTACGGRGGGPRHPVILISVDTLRADHLSCYGYGKATTRRIDAFRRDASLFRQTIAHAPSTLPSHASMLTSLLPSHHGASVANGLGLDPHAVSLTEVLKSEGYRTASFNGGIQLDPIYGLDRGFDVYEAARPSVANADVLVDPVDMFDHAVDEAVAWIEESKGAPFFLFLHTYEVHHPYTPDAKLLASLEPDYDGPLPKNISVDLLQQINRGEITIDDADRAHVIAAYDAEIRSVDEAFGRLIDFLRDEHLYDETLIVFTSDHGEEFGEHGFMGWHSHTLFDELLRVPLLVKLPGSRHAGATVDALVRSIDLAPTILAELGIDAPDAFEGESLLALLDGSGTVPPFAVSRKDVVASDDFASIRTAEWKWFRGQLFDLANDPGETANVAEEHPDVAQKLSKTLADLVAARPRPEPHEVRPDPELVKKLRSLGYIP